MKDRCITDEQKTEFCLQLLEIWKASPELRFGQLLLNSIKNTPLVHKDIQSLDTLKLAAIIRDMEVTFVNPAERERKLYNIEDLELLRGLK